MKGNTLGATRRDIPNSKAGPQLLSAEAVLGARRAMAQAMGLPLEMVTPQMVERSKYGIVGWIAETHDEPEPDEIPEESGERYTDLTPRDYRPYSQLSLPPQVGFSRNSRREAECSMC